MTSKRIITLLLAVFLSTYYLCNPAIAQSGNVDSIRSLLAKHTAENEERADLLITLSLAHQPDNVDSSYKYATRALALSEKIDYNKGKANAYQALGSHYYTLSKFDTSLKIYDKGLTIAKKNSLLVSIGSILNDIGSVYLRKTEYESAIAYYDSARAVGRKTQNKLLLAKASSNIGSIYYKMGNYAKALIDYQESLMLYEGQKAWIDIQYSLLNISNVYYRLGDYPMAIKYADSCARMMDKYGTPWSKVSVLTTHSMIYGKQGKYDSALYYELEALKSAEQTQSNYLVNLIHQNLAECYLDLGDLDKAYNIYMSSISESKRIEDPEGVAVANAGVGQVLLKKGRVREGIRYLEKGLEGLRELELREDAKQASYTLFESYEKLGDYRNALKYFKENRKYTDSLNNNSEKAKVRQMQFQMELGEKQDRIDKLKQAQVIDEKKNDVQKVLLIAALIGLLLSAAIAYLVYRNLKNLQKSKALIEKQKEEIEHQAQHLTNLNNFKDMTFSVLSHDLRSPINALSSTLMLLDEEVITPEEFAIHKQELDTKLNSVNLILDNLLLWARDQMKGENMLRKELIDLYKKVVECIGVLQDPAKNKNITIINNVPENTNAFADRNQTLMVVRNILSNAVKFTPVNGIITVNATKDDEFTIISITDTGVGMSPEVLKHLFDGDTNSSTIGTSGEKGTGIGLMLAYRFVQQNGGDIIVDSVEGKGTTFYIQLPNKEL
ncbi:MAG: tetratricopeptide repeat protein [Flavipsychrobacter sp.]